MTTTLISHNLPNSDFFVSIRKCMYVLDDIFTHISNFPERNDVITALLSRVSAGTTPQLSCRLDFVKRDHVCDVDKKDVRHCGVPGAGAGFLRPCFCWVRLYTCGRAFVRCHRGCQRQLRLDWGQPYRSSAQLCRHPDGSHQRCSQCHGVRRTNAGWLDCQ